jgi:hypothetical protein
MNTPLRENIALVRLAALDLHKLLLQAVRRDYERVHGRIASTGELLNLVTYDQAFAWLHPLSELIVALDELLDIPEHTDSDAAAVRVELEELLSRSGERFQEPYVAALQTDPALVVAHAALQRALASLPATPPDQIEQLREARLGWATRAEQHRRR